MFTLFSLDAKNVEPIAVIAFVALAGYFGWRYLKNQSAASSAGSSATAPAYASPLAGIMQSPAFQMAALQTLFGNQTGAATAASGASNTSATTGTAPVGSVSTPVATAGAVA